MAGARREPTVQSLAQGALAEVDVLVESVVPMIVETEPPGFYDDEALADLRLALRDGLVSMLGLLAQVADESAYESARTTGRRQIQQALPLEGSLRAYRLAGRAIWLDLVARARADGAPVGESLLDGATEVWRVVDDFCAAVAQAYRQEEALLRDRDVRVKSAVLAALLEGRGADPQFARDARQALGLPGGKPLVCVVGLSDSPDALALEHAGERLRIAGLTSVWASFAGCDVGLVVVGSGGPGRIRQVLAAGARVRAGMSPPFTELAELPAARHLADIAARCVVREGVRVLAEDLVAGLVVDAPLIASMIFERTVGRLLTAEGPGGPALLDTLRAFLEADGSVNDAAPRMFLHRNTMVYRLNKIEKATGLSVRRLEDQVLWVLALKVMDARQV